CQNGTTVHTAVPVDDNNVCTTDACDPSTGNISHTPVPDGTAGASDNNPWSVDDGQSGVTVHNAVTTDDGNPCTTDACNPSTGAITHTNVPDGSPGTSDGNPCTNDVCQNGTTVHNAVPVDDGNVCTTDACDPSTGNISHTPVPDGTAGASD